MSAPVVELDKLTACGLFRVRVTIEQVVDGPSVAAVAGGMVGACEILSSLAMSTAAAIEKALAERRGT